MEAWFFLYCEDSSYAIYDLHGSDNDFSFPSYELNDSDSDDGIGAASNA